MSEANLRDQIAHLDICIRRRKIFISTLSDEKYVERSQIPQAVLALLDSKQRGRVEQDLATRQSALGAAVFAEKRRPYEFATRDRNPDIKAAAKRLKELQTKRSALVEQLEQWLESAVDSSNLPQELAD